MENNAELNNLCSIFLRMEDRFLTVLERIEYKIDETNKRIDDVKNELHNEIIQVKEELNTKIDLVKEELHNEIIQVKEELHSEIIQVKEELNTKIDLVKEELHNEIIQVKEELHSEIIQVKEELHSEIIQTKDEILQAVGNEMFENHLIAEKIQTKNIAQAMKELEEKFIKSSRSVNEEAKDYYTEE